MDDITTPQRPLPLTDPLGADDDEHRHHDCTGYQACLDYAAEANWPSWSCCMCNARRSVRVEVSLDGLDADGVDVLPWSRPVLDPRLKKVVAGRYHVCQARNVDDDTIMVAVVSPPDCPACLPNLFGDHPVVGARGCSDGHEWYVMDGTLYVAFEGMVGRPWEGGGDE